MLTMVFLSNIVVLKEYGRRHSKDYLKCEDYPIVGGCDIHKDDMDFIEDEEAAQQRTRYVDQFLLESGFVIISSLKFRRLK